MPTIRRRSSAAPRSFFIRLSPRSPTLRRRDFLCAALAASAWPARAQKNLVIRVASNQGAENAALQQLLTDTGFARKLALDVQLVESRTVSGPMESVLSGEADVCMVSAYVGVLPAIAEGKPLRLIGAAMLLPALAIYSGVDGIQRVEDLPGHTVGVGPVNGLLHILMLALLQKKGVEAAKVKFVNSGSNAQVLEAVAAGKVDAGLSGVAGLSSTNGPHVIENGRLWLELPEYTYQPSYASVDALKNPEAVARCLAAYTQLYRYLSSPESKAAYINARRRTGGDTAIAEAEAVWNFIQRYQPYALEPGISKERVDYLQRLNVSLGLQSRLLEFDQVAR